LLDTNVVSEPVRRKPDGRVLDWLRGLPVERTFVSILTLAEIDQGVEALADQDARRAPLQRFRARLEAEFAGRILSLDDGVVRRWGQLSGRYRARLGGKAPVIDALLAATADRHQLYVATRNVRDLEAIGAMAFDPWTGDPTQYPVSL
jgi:predicted nucleic acid-binding protein